MCSANVGGQEIQALEKATKDETIIDLAQRNLALQNEVVRLQAQLSVVSSELDKQKSASVQKMRQWLRGHISKKKIVKFVEEIFKSGRVPQPYLGTDKNLLNQVVCSEDGIHFVDKGNLFVVRVHFSNSRISVPLVFSLELKPTADTLEYFPDFHYGFNSPSRSKS